MKKFFWILVVILLIALITRPNHEDHKDKIKRKFKENNPVTGAVGGGNVFAGMVNYHDYYIFTTTTLQDKTVSVGAFQVVYVYKDLDIDIELNNN